MDSLDQSRGFKDVDERLAEFASDPEFVQETVRMFIEFVDETLDELALNVGNEDAAACRALAHQIKGTGWSLGATRLGNIADELQQHTDRGEFERVKELLSELTDEYKPLRDYLAKDFFPDA